MSIPSEPVAHETPAEPRHRPWVWIALCGVLVLAIAGVTIWALSLQSDLDDQRDQTAAAQQQTANLSSQVDQLTQDVNDAIAQAGETTADAKQQLQGSLADLKDRLGALAAENPAPAETSGTPEATATPAENATPGGP